jgi:4-hydroxy-2-oxovalerate/4-hydroxy-2-oxohexanoate aldolase
MKLQDKKVTVHDMTLRDGMRPKRHLMTLDQMKSIASGLDAAGVPLIEVTHGDVLGGSSVNYGFPAHSDEEYLGAVIPLMKQAKVSALQPGIGTVDHLLMAKDLGVATIRVATHCTEADVSEQHITKARALGMDTVGFLMMAHMSSPEELVSQAKLMEGYGANCIYVTDSAGYLLPEGVIARLSAVPAALKPGTELGFHGHHNLAMGVANSIAAIEAGANRIDRDSLTPGYAGVYSSFLLFAKRASAKYGVPARDILVELGRRGMVAGRKT